MLVKDPTILTSQVWNDNTIPMVSISCRTYNHENFIREAIEGFLMQKTTFRVEILIHDDASTDRTSEIVREYENKYPQLFKCFYQHINTYSLEDKAEKKRLTRPFKEARRGKYIALCEGDDYWTDPLKLQKQVEFLEANSDYSGCFTNATFLNEIENTSRKYVTNLKQGDVNIKDIILIGGYIYPTASIVYKQDQINGNQFMAIPQMAGDTNLILNLAIIGKVYFIDEITCTYRRWSGGMYSSIKHSKSKIADWKRQRIEGYIKFNQYTNYKYRKHINIKISSECLYVLRYGIGFKRYILIRHMNIKDIIKFVIKR